MNDVRKVIIIGSGPAGLTAAIYAARSNLKPLVIDGKNPGGQLMGTSFVENWPGIPSILGPQLMMNMREHAQRVGTEFLGEEIVDIDVNQRPFTLKTSTGATLNAHAVILSMGTVPRKLGCPGEKEYWGKGVTTCAVCDGAFYRDKSVIVVGGGDSAMEEASFLNKFTNKITVIHILDKFTASYVMQKRVLDNPHIKVIYNSTITSIEGDGSHVTHAVITDQKTKQTQKVDVNGIFIAIGLTPKTECIKNKVELNTYGYIILKDHAAKTATSVEGIFAAGDVADPHYRQAVLAAGTGCAAALDVEEYLKSIGV